MEPHVNGAAQVRVLRATAGGRPPRTGARSKAQMQPDGTLLINISDKVSNDNKQPTRSPKQPQRYVVPVVATNTRFRKPYATVALQPCKMYQQLSNVGCGLKKRTLATYCANLKVARQICDGISVKHMLRDARGTTTKIAAAVQKHNLSHWSHAAYLNSILSCARAVLTCRSKAQKWVQEALGHLKNSHHAVYVLASQPAAQNRATSKQQLGFMSYKELCAVRDKLPRGSKARLLLAWLTMIPPCKADLACCRIFSSPPTEHQLTEYKGNYIVLPPKGSGQPLVCWRVYKTSKTYGQVAVALPPCLVEETEHNLQLEPREFLFTQEKSDGLPYTRASFSKLACTLLKTACDNPYLTLQLVRHAYSSMAQSVYDESQCNSEGDKAVCRIKKQQIARAMMHSDKQSRAYVINVQENGVPLKVDETNIVQRPKQVPNTPLIITLCG